MDNRKLAIGCGVVGVLGLLACGGIAAMGVRMFHTVAGPMIAAEQDRQTLADNWQPPAADADPQAMFPAQTAGYALESHDDQAAIPELDIAAVGHHVVYRSGASQIDVYLYPMTRSEADAAFDRLQQIYDAQEGQSGVRSWSAVRLGDSVHANLSAGELGQNHLWWMKEWLLVFRTQDSEDREEFVKSFLGHSAP